MTFIIVRERLGNKAIKAAEVSIEANHITVSSDTKILSSLIKRILPIPTKVKERRGDKVFKSWPKTPQQNLMATLKQNLYSPYRLARNKELIEDRFKAEYQTTFNANILNGEDRHELSARKAS
jgi:hypothetical protein